MHNLLRIGSIAILFLLIGPRWTLAQSASSGSKSIKPQAGVSPLNSQDASDHQPLETRRAAAPVEWRSKYLQAEYANVDGQLKKSMDEVQKFDNQLSESHLSIESFPDILKMLQSSRVELVIDLAGLEARQQELLKQRDAAQPNQQALLAKEVSIAQELVNLSREEFKLQEEKFRNGRSVSTEVLTASKELKLAELRLALAESKSAESLNAGKSELSSLILDRAEKAARLAVVEKLLKSTSDAKPLVTSLQNSQEQVQALISLSRRLMNEMREANLEREENKYLLEKSNEPSVDQK